MDEQVRARSQAFLVMGGYDPTRVAIEIKEAWAGKARLRVVVVPALQNLGGNLDGSAIATIVEAEALKRGHNMARVSVDLRCKADGKLIAQGRVSEILS